MQHTRAGSDTYSDTIGLKTLNFVCGDPMVGIINVSMSSIDADMHLINYFSADLTTLNTWGHSYVAILF